jgi:hypothetical protein
VPNKPERPRATQTLAVADQAIEVRTDPHGVHHLFEYRWAAQTLLLSVATEGELLARPVCYLARHALELALKQALMEADAEYHHNEIDFKPFQESEWRGHDLHALHQDLEQRLHLTGNPPVSDRTRRLVDALHDLDPDGQRFRYGRAILKRGTTILSLKPGTRIDLRWVVDEVDYAIRELLELNPERPRADREFEERRMALLATQHLPVWHAPEDFGHRRSPAGEVVMPRSAAGDAGIGQVIRVMDQGGLEISWFVVGLAGDDLVLDMRPEGFRLPKDTREKRLRRGVCPECAGQVAKISRPMKEPTVLYEAGAISGSKTPAIQKLDMQCRSCRHRFQAYPVPPTDQK